VSKLFDRTRGYARDPYIEDEERQLRRRARRAGRTVSEQWRHEEQPPVDASGPGCSSLIEDFIPLTCRDGQPWDDAYKAGRPAGT
jgi:hypothetical protein